jgi:hypothetical protein
MDAARTIALAALVTLFVAPATGATQPFVYELGGHEIVGLAAECVIVVLPGQSVPPPAAVYIRGFDGTVDRNPVEFDRLVWYAKNGEDAHCEFEGVGAVEIAGIGSGVGVGQLPSEPGV